MALTLQQRRDVEDAIIDAAQAEILAATQKGVMSYQAGDQSVDWNGYIQALEQRIAAAQERKTKFFAASYALKSRRVS